MLSPVWTSENAIAYVESATDIPPRIQVKSDFKETTWVRNDENVPLQCLNREQNIEYESFDKTPIRGFWYPTSRSAIVFVHDGPLQQFRPVFHPWVHYFNARGFSVLAINARGSHGYGALFSKADDGTKRKDSFEDVRRAASWLKKKLPSRRRIVSD